MSLPPIKILGTMDLWCGQHFHQCCASVLEVEKECDKDANEIIGRRIQFSEIILKSISEMIESMVANKDTKKKAEENENDSVQLHDMEGAWIGSYI